MKNLNVLTLLAVLACNQPKENADFKGNWNVVKVEYDSAYIKEKMNKLDMQSILAMSLVDSSFKPAKMLINDKSIVTFNSISDTLQVYGYADYKEVDKKHFDLSINGSPANAIMDDDKLAITCNNTTYMLER